MNRTAIRILSGIGYLLCIIAAVWGYRNGIFTSEDTARSFIMGYGSAAAIIFMLFQVIQVVIPILPGGISCLLGIILFGTVNGFIYNYIGICIGSLIVFGIAKVYGKPILNILFPQKLIDKYHHLMHEKDRFSRFFTWAIFFPIAPDDFLCYVAGTTQMSWKRFSAVILMGKPLSIALYSYGLYLVYDQVVTQLFS